MIWNPSKVSKKKRKKRSKHVSLHVGLKNIFILHKPPRSSLNVSVDIYIFLKI